MRIGVQEGSTAWAVVYDEAPNPVLALELRTVLPWLHGLRMSTVIDVACGTGRWSKLAAGRGARIFGADFSAAMLERAARGGRSRGGFVQADALQLPFPDATADLCICAFAAGYLPSPAEMLAEMQRVTAPTGYLLVTDLHPAAVASGWQRSFRRDGEVYEIDHRAPAVAEYLECGRRFGLTLEHLAEPSFGPAERQIFSDCGREDRFDDLCRTPAIFAALWRNV